MRALFVFTSRGDRRACSPETRPWTSYYSSKQGHSIRRIARDTGHSRNTVRRAVREGARPQFQTPVRPSKLDPFKDYRRAAIPGAQALGDVSDPEDPQKWASKAPNALSAVSWPALRVRRPSHLTIRFETPPAKKLKPMVPRPPLSTARWQLDWRVLLCLGARLLSALSRSSSPAPCVWRVLFAALRTLCLLVEHKRNRRMILIYGLMPGGGQYLVLGHGPLRHQSRLRWQVLPQQRS